MLLGDGAVLVWNDVAPEGRDQFYAWHDREHIPERLGIPGFRRGRRYARSGHSPEWFTLYEADDLDVVTSPTYLERLNAPTAATQRTLPYFRNTSRAVCRLAHSVGGSSGGFMLTLRLQVPQAREDALRRVVSTELFPGAMAINGVLACHLLATDSAGSYTETAESRTRAFDVPAWVVLAETSTLAAAERVATLLTGPALRDLDVTVRSDGAAYALEICRLANAASSAQSS